MSSICASNSLLLSKNKMGIVWSTKSSSMVMKCALPLKIRKATHVPTLCALKIRTTQLPASIPFQINGLAGEYQTPPSDEPTSPRPAPNNVSFQTQLQLVGQFVGPIGIISGMIFSKNLSPYLSHNAKILWNFAIVSNIISFVCLFTGILMCGRLRELTTRITTVIGYVGVAFGFIALLSMLLSDTINLWVAFTACALCIPAIVVAIVVAIRG